MALPTGKTTSEFTPIEPGNYEVTAKSLHLNIEKAYKSEAHNDGDGLRYQAIAITWDVDGDEWTERFIPLKVTDGAKFYNRLVALFGRKLTEDDELTWGIASDAKKNLAIDDYYQAGKDDPENNVKKGQYVVKETDVYNGIEGTVTSLTVNGEEIIGKSCLLQIDVNAKNYNRAGAEAAAPLPKRATREKAPATEQAPSGMPT